MKQKKISIAELRGKLDTPDISYLHKLICLGIIKGLRFNKLYTRDYFLKPKDQRSGA